MSYLVNQNNQRIYSIYKVTNKVNGKIYIGFDSNWPKRKYSHKSYSKTDNYFYKFYNAIRKYGWETFEWEVICQSLDGEYLLSILEPYFIEYYDSYRNGYNITKGGEGRLGAFHTKEAIQKMKNKVFSKNTREKMSKSSIGIKHTLETKNKLSKQRMNNNYSAKNYILIEPSGIIHTITNLAKFCKNNPQYNLNYNSMRHYPTNNNIYKGWKIIAL